MSRSARAIAKWTADLGERTSQDSRLLHINHWKVLDRRLTLRIRSKPDLQLVFEGEDRLDTRAGHSMNWQTGGGVPPLDGAHISFEGRSDILPRVELRRVDISQRSSARTYRLSTPRA